MSRSKTETFLKSLLQAALPVLYLVAAISFFVGGRFLHEAYKVDRTLAEVIGIGFAVVCAFATVIAKRAIEEIDWEKANEKAAEEEKPKS